MGSRLVHWLATRSGRFYIVVAVVWVVPLGLADYWTDYRLRLIGLYLPPLVMMAWTARLRAGLLATLGMVVLWASVHLLKPHPTLSTGIVLWNVSMILFTFLVIFGMAWILKVQSYYADHDFLTGIANRRGLYRFALHELQRSRRYRRPMTVGYIDCDDFKAVNDRWGHTTGNAVLCTVARTADRSIRATDLVARVGGDEFAVLLPATGPEEAKLTFEKLHERLASAMLSRGWPVTFSIGVVTFQGPPESVDELLAQADQQMYAVKLRGKNNQDYAVATAGALQPTR